MSQATDADEHTQAHEAGAPVVARADCGLCQLEASEPRYDVINHAFYPATCGVCGASIRFVEEADWSGWLDEYDDQLSYDPHLHDHVPGQAP